MIVGLGLAVGCKKDPCKDKNCGNGTCSEGNCNCNTGWSGADCNTQKSSVEIWVWNKDSTAKVSGALVELTVYGGNCLGAVRHTGTTDVNGRIIFYDTNEQNYHIKIVSSTFPNIGGGCYYLPSGVTQNKNNQLHIPID